jgi:tyrosinase
MVPAEGEGVFPSSFQSPSITIDGPAGIQTIANPLYTYRFDPLNTTELSDIPVRLHPKL